MLNNVISMLDLQPVIEILDVWRCCGFSLLSPLIDVVVPDHVR